MKIVVTSASFSRNQMLVDEIKKYFKTVILNTQGVSFSKSELIEILNDADGAIIGLEQINKEILDSCPK